MAVPMALSTTSTFVRGNRRQGLGRESLRALFAECERLRVLAVHVEAGRDNVAAQRLYRSFGLDVLDKARQLLTVRLRPASNAD